MIFGGSHKNSYSDFLVRPWRARGQGILKPYHEGNLPNTNITLRPVLQSTMYNPKAYSPMTNTSKMLSHGINEEFIKQFWYIKMTFFILSNALKVKNKKFLKNISKMD
jgi:hypothetical protein